MNRTFDGQVPSHSENPIEFNPKENPLARSIEAGDRDHDPRTRQFEIVDRIYKNELTEIESHLKSESRKKLKKLNQSIEARLAKGSDVNQVKVGGENEAIAEASALKNGRERLNELLGKVK